MQRMNEERQREREERQREMTNMMNQMREENNRELNEERRRLQYRYENEAREEAEEFNPLFFLVKPAELVVGAVK